MGTKPKGKGLIRAAGGVVWEGTIWNSRIAVIYRHRREDWSLPKGKLDAGETFKEAAVREIKEETGYEVKLHDLAGEIHYHVNNRPKVVRYWHATVENNAGFEPDDEVEKVEWFELNEAIERLDYESERKILRNRPSS